MPHWQGILSEDVETKRGSGGDVRCEGWRLLGRGNRFESQIVPLGAAIFYRRTTPAIRLSSDSLDLFSFASVDGLGLMRMLGQAQCPPGTADVLVG